MAQTTGEVLKNGLVKKIGWTEGSMGIWPSDIKSFLHCQKLEEEGFGMLADKDNPDKMDGSDSVVCPDGSVFTPKQMEGYWNQKGRSYSSENPEDIKMHKANLYYFGFVLCDKPL